MLQVSFGVRRAAAALSRHRGPLQVALHGELSTWRILLQVRELAAYVARLGRAGNSIRCSSLCSALVLSACEIRHCVSYPPQVRELAAYVVRQAEAGAQRLQYEVATVTRLQPVGMGDRSALFDAALYGVLGQKHR